MNVLGENCCSDMLYSVVHSSTPLCSKGPVVRKTVSAGVNVMMFDSSCIKWCRTVTLEGVLSKCKSERRKHERNCGAACKAT